MHACGHDADQLALWVATPRAGWEPFDRDVVAVFERELLERLREQDDVAALTLVSEPGRRRIALGLAAATEIVATAVTASAENAAGWATPTFGAAAAVLTAVLLVDAVRRRWVSDPARRRGPVALLQRAVLGALITTTVAIVERRLRKALERRPRWACNASAVARVVDAEGAHLAAILRAADFSGRRVLEVGSGEGRLTWGFAPVAASVLAFDPDEAVVGAARAECADELREKVHFEVARAEEIEVPPHSIDLVLFSWSLWWMEPEGVVDVLRRLLRSLVPDGVVVDLLSVPPNERVEVAGEVVGELDGSAFFPRALAAAAGLDALAAEGMLVHEHEEGFPIFVRYPSGADLVEDVARREYTRMPRELARRVRTLTGPCELRDNCLVRRFRKLR